MTLEYNPYIYPSPDFSLPAIGQLHSGYTITVTKKQNGWIQFPYDGIQAWIPEEGTTQPGTGQANAGSGAANQNQQPPDVQPPANSGNTDTQQPAKQTATVQTDGLNLRAESNTASAVLGTLKAGSTLTVLEKKKTGTGCKRRTAKQDGSQAGS